MLISLLINSVIHCLETENDVIKINDSEKYYFEKKVSLEEIINRCYDKNIRKNKKKWKPEQKASFTKVDREYLTSLFNIVSTDPLTNPIAVFDMLGSNLFILTFSNDKTFLNEYSFRLNDILNRLILVYNVGKNKLLSKKYIPTFLKRLNECIYADSKSNDISNKVFMRWLILFFAVSNTFYYKSNLTIEKKDAIKFLFIFVNEYLTREAVFLSVYNSIVNLVLGYQLPVPTNPVIDNFISQLIKYYENKNNLRGIIHSILKYQLKIHILVDIYNIVTFYIEKPEQQSSFLRYYKFDSENDFFSHFMTEFFRFSMKDEYMYRRQILIYISSRVLEPSVLTIFNFYFSGCFNLFKELGKNKITSKSNDNDKLDMIRAIKLMLKVLFDDKLMELKQTPTSKDILKKMYYSTLEGIFFRGNKKIKGEELKLIEVEKDKYVLDIEGMYRELLIRNMLNLKDSIIKLEEDIKLVSNSRLDEEYNFYFINLMMKINEKKKEMVFPIKNETNAWFIKFLNGSSNLEYYREEL
ncbi:hypothetical protein TCON_1392 [Astathelohania contejeani]|uniref:Uncharacterized protein n=1 Tax=Astathelohania contejeani TaxID=164912 RepID=A0ABQ7HYX7_9MICR|nr:hypothetical protein TCON_1392 [Thelohania contejeani]